MEQEMRNWIQCKKFHALDIGKSAMRHSWTYKLGLNTISTIFTS